MRFRYFDLEGTEIEVATVDALRFRIRTGAVNPDTLLYDAAVGQWAPAHHHSVFRFLVEEDEDLLPAVFKPLMDELVSSSPLSDSPVPDDPPVPGVRPEPEPESAPGTAPGDESGWGTAFTSHIDSMPDVSSGSELEAMAGPVDEAAGPSDPGSLTGAAADGETADAEREDEERDEREGGADFVMPGTGGIFRFPEPAGEGADVADAAEGAGRSDGLGFPDLRPTPADFAGPDPTSAVNLDLSGTNGAKAASDRFGSAAGPLGPGPLSGRSVAAPRSRVRWSRDGSSAGRKRRRPPTREWQGAEGGRGSIRRRLPRVMAWAAAVAFFLVGVPVMILRASGTDREGAAFAEVGVLEPSAAAETDPGGGTPASDGDVLGGRTPVLTGGNRGGTVARDPLADETRRDRQGLSTLAGEVAAAASGDLEGAMSELQETLDLADRPPAIWLQGRYLSDAQDYPEVRRYWQGFASFVSSMEELHGELYRGFVRSRVLRMRLDTAEATQVRTAALERYEDLAGVRASVYGELSTLAEEALTLHETLVARNREISYEPFDGRTLSRDPVIEAVADDPVLAEEIWNRLDRIFDLLDEIQGVRPVSTAHLQAALLEGLRRP